MLTHEAAGTLGPVEQQSCRQYDVEESGKYLKCTGTSGSAY